ncbi:elongation factor 2 [Penicillium cinerascens]|uniref:Elongation factor 2 n=1 Tax=Penicillium cinerascens TaxID=70096 RepID=A0A9W9J681_9EURO|nr:elongation factor 2 [Penicillium cinerascens]KAJ5191309.1 elongation factor 2 [Penicillium cinerascens]
MDPQSDTTISSNLEVNKCPSFLSIGGTEKQHIDCALQDLKRDTGVDFGISDLTPAYRETITCPHLLPIMTISPNRFITFMSAEPLEDEVVSFIESGEIKHDDLNTRVSKFRDDLGIEEDYIKRIMFFGPDDQVANFMVDETRGNTMVPKAKKYFSEGFQRATAEGPLIHEPMRACRFTLEDFQKPHLKEDDQELIDTVKLAIHNITLLASPVLVEPI